MSDAPRPLPREPAVAGLRASQIESAVRAAVRGGVRVLRVTVDHARGRIEIETAEAEPPRPTFDTLDFRAAR